MPDTITPHEFFVIDQGNRSWEFIDENTGQPGKIESSRVGADRILLKLDLGAEKGELEWQILQLPDPLSPGQTRPEYNLVRSTRSGTVLTWGNKIRIPYYWTVGSEVKAVSRETNPATGSPVELAIKLAANGHVIPKPGWGRLYPEGMVLPGWIQVDQFAKDVKLGTVLVKMSTVYALGVGSIYAAGQVFGVFSVLHLVKHTP